MAAPSPTDDDRLRAALERERTRLADALHDGALQDLAVARQNWTEAHEGDRDALAALRDDLERLADQLRTLTTGMHEETLAELPLDEALDRVVRSVCLRGTPAVDVRTGGDVPDRLGGTVRALVRELIANVVRHADAGTAEVVVEREGGEVVVRVRDDGRGFDPDAAAAARAAGHLGLARIERAVERLGGTFVIASTPPSGTLAVATLPA